MITELDQTRYVLLRETLPCGIPRIDEDQGANTYAFLSGLADRLVELVDIEAPRAVLLEVVRHQLSVVQGDRGGI